MSLTMENKKFLFYLTNTSTGNCWYVDAQGNLKQAPISFGIGDGAPDLTCCDPSGWMTSTLGFIRNTKYYGINRSFTDPQELINDAAFIARTLINKGRGIEVPLTMVIYMYNDTPVIGEPTYLPFYKGQIDIPNHKDVVGEGVQANLMEGGVLQFLKYIENTPIQIPCDGSLNEAFPDGTYAKNIRVLMDGMYTQDTLTYQIVPMQSTNAGVATLACTLVGEDGDSIGITKNNPTYDPLASSPYGGSYYQQSNNFLMSSAGQTTVTVKGNIIVASSNLNKQLAMGLFLATNRSGVIEGTDEINNSLSLIPPGGLEGSGSLPVFTNEVSISFNGTMTIATPVTSGGPDIAENLFLQFNDELGNPANINIIGGSFTVEFASKNTNKSVWGLTLYDLGRVLVKYGCEIASQVGPITYNYQFASQLLQQKLNLVVASGDALRAAGDPNYQKFYNAIQNNPNFPNINLNYSYGPVLKTTIAEYFESVNALLNTSMSTQVLQGQNEMLFIESKGYVFDSSITNLENGEVTDFTVTPAVDLYFTLFKIGYQAQMTDQKAGKWAWNTTATWQTPFKSIPSKTFELICKYCADPFVIERLLADIDDTSTTRNSSDNTVFLINTDPTLTAPDTYSAQFVSPAVTQFPTNPNQDGNTNMKLQQLQWLSSIPLTNIQGNWLANSSDAVFFLFNQQSLVGVSMPVTLTINGNFYGYPANALSGLLADTTTINLVVNGVVIQSWSYTATGAQVPIAINYAANHTFSFKDCIYLTCSTSAGGTTILDTVNLNIANVPGTSGDGSNYLSATGSAITINPGIIQQLIALPAVDATTDRTHTLRVMSWGFQYFYFNSALLAGMNSFDVEMTIAGMVDGGSGDLAGWDIYLNGQVQYSQTWPGTPTPQPISGGTSYSFTRNFQPGDILFMVGSTTNLQFWVTEASIELTSTEISTVGLKRVQYDYISGLPPLCGYTSTGVPVTTGAGAYYNYEDISPGHMIRNHGNYLRSIMFDQIPGELMFCKLDKNEYVATSYQGFAIVQNANIDISTFDPPLFYPRYLTYKTRVQDTFAQVLTGAYNAHASNTYNMVPFYGFPWELKQQPALNEMQQWKMLCSPKTDLTVLDNLYISGVNFINMSPNSIWASILSPDQWVPENNVLSKKYHTWPRNGALYAQQIDKWINQTGYWQPVQIGDQRPVQLYTRDLNAVTLYVMSCATGLAVQTINMTRMSSPAVQAPYYLWETTIDTTGLTAGGYFLRAVGGNGAITASLVAEGWSVRADWPKTVLLEYTHSTNKESLIFDTGFVGSMRVFGFFDNTAEFKFKASWYTDQRQSSKPINSFRYEVSELWLGIQDGNPDYIFDKTSGILLCDGCTYEGQGYTINENEEWEPARQVGNPKSFKKIKVRPSDRQDGVGAVATGIDTSSAMLVTLDQTFFGPNAGNLGGTDPDIIQVNIENS